ncbi:SAM hydrolase/SAM-dependent halogenase family protein [Archaeoglobus sp.]
MIVTLLTDFGDFYPGVMKGVILKINPKAIVVDVSHSVEPQNVFQGAFLLYNAYKFFPNAVHIAVVDPGVGGRRRALAFECRNHIFIAPDNGIAYPSAKDDGIERVWVIDERKTSKITGVLSNTFHGRDVFAPAGAYASIGLLKEIAEPYEDEVVKLELFDYVVEDNFIRCNVVFIDRFGNVVTNLKAEEIKGKYLFFEGVKIPIVRCYEEVEKGKPLALIGSFGTLELSVREGSFAEEFGVSSSDSIELKQL